MMKTNFNTISCYIITILTGGTSWYATTLQLTDVSPVISLIYRFTIAALILLLLSQLNGSLQCYTWRQHGLLALMGFLCFSLAFLLIYQSAELITSSFIALIYSTVIFFNTLNAALFFKQRLLFSVITAAVIGSIGIFLVFLPELFTGNWNWLGFIYALGATIAFSFSNVCANHLQSQGINVLPMTGYSMCWGVLFLLGYAVITGVPFIFDSSLSYVLSLGWLILFPSVIGYTIYFFIVARLGMQHAAYTLLIVPIMALLISTFTEDYNLSIWTLAGTFLILVGNYIIIDNQANNTQKNSK
ncbi:DMT family transporter [Xenorhabdus budapestensis]|nr:DMT family transporter [Xenorhabdus budapestensis]